MKIDTLLGKGTSAGAAILACLVALAPVFGFSFTDADAAAYTVHLDTLSVAIAAVVAAFSDAVRDIKNH